MIALRNNRELIARLTDLLMAPRHFRSCDLIVPPGFDELGVSQAVISALRHQRPDALIAECAIDEVADADSFVRRLADYWKIQNSGLSPDSLPPDQRLPLLFSQLPADRPAILVLRRFHKLLAVLPAWLLGALRTAEQQGSIRTLVLCPVSTQELKQRWLSEGHPLVVSNYGDTHARYFASLIHPDDLGGLMTEFELPKHIADYAFSASGGYPEVFVAMARSWHDQGKPQHLNQLVKKTINQSADSLCVSFCRKLDPETGGRIFCSHIADLYAGIDVDDAIEMLRRHEWNHLLLTGNDLRCRRIGDISVNLIIEQTRAETGANNRHVIYEKAQSLYRNKLYSAVGRLVEGLGLADKRLELLHLHAQIMDALCPYRGELASIDSNWGIIPSLVRSAKKQAIDCPGADSDMTERLAGRYTSLAKYAQLISENKRDYRPIDKLSATVAADRNKQDLAICTLLLLYLHVQNARSRSDASEGVQLAMALPEQVFRVWALWALDVNYYDRPPGASLSKDSQRLLSSPEIPVLSALPDQQPVPFPSFKYFFLYCRDIATAQGRPEPFAESHGDLELLTNFRNDRAHAVTSASQANNKKFLDLLERWLQNTHQVAPPLAQRMTQREILDIVQPLPIP